MTRLHRSGLALILSIAACGAQAIGDSGGCSGGAPFGRTLTHGTPVELEQKILDWVNRRQPPPGLFKSIGNALRGDADKHKARQQAIKDIIEGTDKAVGCYREALLYHVVQAGNIPVLNYLLDAPLDVNVDVPKDILFRCAHDPSMSNDQRERRRAAFEMLIDKGLADVNARRDGKSVLQVCHAPELVALFLTKGARVDIERIPAATQIDVQP